ncbi:MAG: riboflavin synthase [Candidatus Cloacimonetes bacterium]|nr:riboflavin synthase [Candidatus Cloacimonadota bacterium]
MFTGLIAEIGKVHSLKESGNMFVIEIECSKILDFTEIGDSIAVNGLCLTVTNLSKTTFTADVMPISIEKSALRHLKTGSMVNLEPAMQMKSRFGGHFVSGHIDGIGSIIEIYRSKQDFIFRIKLSQDTSKFLIQEGSISIDGISLTIAKLAGNICELSIIPHTYQNTTLQFKKVGDEINIETDILGKYIFNFMNKKGKTKNISMDFLGQNGFLQNYKDETTN